MNYSSNILSKLLIVYIFCISLKTLISCISKLLANSSALLSLTIDINFILILNILKLDCSAAQDDSYDALYLLFLTTIASNIAYLTAIS